MPWAPAIFEPDLQALEEQDSKSETSESQVLTSPIQVVPPATTTSPFQIGGRASGLRTGHRLTF